MKEKTPPKKSFSFKSCEEKGSNDESSSLEGEAWRQPQSTF